jgi:hypothetical protein
MFKTKFCANFIACILVYPSSWNMVKKQLGFLVFPPSGNMAIVNNFPGFPTFGPLGNMARKQCFLVYPQSGNMARKQYFRNVCPDVYVIISARLRGLPHHTNE